MTTTVLIIFGAIIALSFMIAIIVYIRRKMKGVLKIQLVKNNFTYGEEIIGKIFLHAKQPIESNNLSVNLNCYTETKHHNDKGHYTIDRSLVYNQKYILDNSSNYASGYENYFDFKFRIPYDDEKYKSTFLNLLSKANKLFGTHGRTIRKIEARLDAKGLDLVDDLEINISNFKEQ